VDGERQGVIDWSLQQEFVIRQQSFEPKGNKLGYTFESDGADLSRDGHVGQGVQSPNCIVEACPSLFRLEGDMSEVYPDTPSQTEGFSFLDIAADI
jgi:hypothetical protein